MTLAVASCGYQGDGEYREQGFFIFKTYSLVLPEFDFKTGTEKVFRIKGYGPVWKSRLTLVLVSEEPLSYKDLDTIVELHISGPDGDTYFYRNSALNAHYRRMYAKGEILSASEFEWDGKYEYSAYALDPVTYSESKLHLPANTKEMSYSQIMPTEATEYNVKIKIGNVPEDYDKIKARLELYSNVELTSSLAAQLDPNAQYNTYSWLIESDPSIAYSWLCKSADNGHLMARYTLGQTFEYNKQDHVQAYVWYSLSGTFDEGELQSFVDKKLSTEEYSNAKKILEEWQPGQCEQELGLGPQ
ncbi:MAG: hypothetical protein ACR2QW_17620 [bacterium]